MKNISLIKETDILSATEISLQGSSGYTRFPFSTEQKACMLRLMTQFRSFPSVTRHPLCALKMFFCHINSGIKNVSNIQLVFPKNAGSLLKILPVFLRSKRKYFLSDGFCIAVISFIFLPNQK